MKLGKNDIHLYFVRPASIKDTRLLLKYQSLLSDDEQKQMTRFYFEHHCHQFLVTRALIRTSLSNYFDVRPDNWVFTNNAYGKPQITHPEIDEAIRFNISHADGLIMCGFTRHFDIGVDVENSQRATQAAFSRLSSYFSEHEIKCLSNLPSEHQKQRFFDYWTLKEAYIKARGKGLAIPLRKFSFHFENNSFDHFSVDDDLNDKAENWQFWQFNAVQNYKIAVAVNSGDTQFNISAYKCVPLDSTNSCALNDL